MESKSNLSDKGIVITGASSGFGWETAIRLAQHGVHLALCARRQEKLIQLKKKIESSTSSRVWVASVDMAQKRDIDLFAKELRKHLPSVDVLINNAGGALGKDVLWEARDEDYVQMLETNVLGVFRLSKALLPDMIERKEGHLVMLGSIAGHEAYPGGGGYCASKFALRALTQTLRKETFEYGIRVTSVDPGMAETEFSLVRFRGDERKAKAVYEGIKPLTALDIAEVIEFALTRPKHLCLDEILLTPTSQASATLIHRK